MWPFKSTNAPPLLPGLIAAEVCTMSVSVVGGAFPPPGSVTVRPVAETMPWVTELDRPSGLPIASTIWPIRSFVESAKIAAFSPLGGSASLTTARSPCGKDAINLASSGVRPVESVTLKVVADPMTWALVTMSPFVSRITPEPRPDAVSMRTIDGSAVATTCS